ncbi:hypothetical protein [Enterocloster clostridioformis]|uniref:Uncharacterized protein n=1 Tax=Enterocloster clostridioformis TaxID=1531 RepID=A0A174T1J0_9FIRM|nr:hypothetical protein [Enterocloster clostridioformis]CUQ01240.1 Uncharacterised protein [Enterocloster clostridioformis]
MIRGQLEEFTDEELLKEFEAVKRMTVHLPIPDPKLDEFETIWKRIQEGKEKEKQVIGGHRMWPGPPIIFGRQ